MQYTSIGDISHSLLMRGHNTRLKTDLARISETLASGRHADMSAHLRGDFSGLAATERAIRSLTAHQVTAKETATLLRTAQTALGTVQDIAAGLAPALVSAGSSGHPALVHSTSADAFQKLDSIVAALNVRIADRAVFSGQATDQPALLDASEMILALKAHVAGETTPDGVVAAVADWFNAPGAGFALEGYLGGAQSLAPIPVSDTERVTFATRADDPAIRAALESFALAALVRDLPALADTDDAAAVLRKSGERMLSAQTNLALLRSDIGAREAYTDAAIAGNAAALAGHQIERAALYEADPYKAATELELVQAQLEAVYTLTARISRLSLSDYLR